MKSNEIKKFRKTYKVYEKPCIFEGYQLAVTFDEKDDVKRCGGRWDKDLKTWWIPKDKVKLRSSRLGNLTVLDWLNNSQMVMGHYGERDWDINFDLWASQTMLRNCKSYRLKKSHSKTTPHMDHEYIVRWYNDIDAVEFSHSDKKIKEKAEWFPIIKARVLWDTLIGDGYNNVKTENNS